ncbi:LysR family transcriptional regulator [Pseudorhodoferax aquiterrae]|uniref:LysR family transcriptional regulator n=1 Tax=Pseudorhodoferax aquiterrae TaxID=747304 RepID=A0ABQ3G7E3_9BURK|nr:LysR family transcriptional regulator [Pseudorhodoferax aquiterrae]GHC92664.1 LysR family transcriptional regulator [Pseudorhodoferax aquiterrae]
MDELKTMRTFVKVVDEGSFAGAARALNVANSVVTRAVAELEESLKSRLLNRTTRALSLTDVGAQYLERVRSILEDIDDANNQASEATGTIRGQLRVAAPQDFLTASLARLVPRFAQRHPGLNIQLLLSSPEATVPDDAADVTILIHNPDPLDGNFVARLLAHAEVVLCATPEYLRQHAPIAKPEDLLQHTILVPESAFERKVWLFHSDGRDGTPETATLQPQRSAISAHNAAVLIAAARGHFGIAGALSLNVADDLQAGALQRVLPDWAAASYRVYAAVPSRSHLPRRTRAFIEFLVEHYGGEPSDPWLSGKVR